MIKHCFFVLKTLKFGNTSKLNGGVIKIWLFKILMDVPFIENLFYISPLLTNLLVGGN